MRVNVYVPDELVATVRATIPDLNVSAALQGALRGLLSCRHHDVRCVDCAAVIDKRSVIDAALSNFYLDLIDAIERVMLNNGTPTGCGQVAREVAERHGVTAALHRPLRRPSKSQRGRRRELAFPQQRSFRDVEPDYQPPAQLAPGWRSREDIA